MMMCMLNVVVFGHDDLRMESVLEVRLDSSIESSTL